MRRGLIGACAVLLCGALAMEDADARRFGSGRSTGVQRSVPQTPPANTPARPAQQQQAAPSQANPAATAQQPQASGLSRWMPMLGGLALGGLLGYLFAGNGLMGLLLLALLGVGIWMLVRALARRRGEAPQPLQYAGGLGQDRFSGAPPAQAMPVSAASARLPAGFDAVSFLRGAKMNFVKLQLANDQGDLEAIREFTTDELFEELSRDVAERGASRQQTDIEGLDAELVDVATEGPRHWASVRFSGRVREAPRGGPSDFAEVWNLVKPADGSSGWLLAGIQQMH